METSYLDDVAKKILSCKAFTPIIYLITEDPEVIHELLARGDCFEVLKKVDGNYRACCYEKGIEDSNLVFKEGYNTDGSRKIDSKFVFLKNPQLPQYFIVTDWQLLKDDFSVSDKQKSIIINFVNEYRKQNEWPYRKNLVIISNSAPYDSIPSGYEQYVQVIDVPLLGIYDICMMVAEKQNTALRILPEEIAGEISPEAYVENPDAYVSDFKGMSRTQIRYILEQISNQYGWVSYRGLPSSVKTAFSETELNRTARKLIFSQKQQAVSRDGSISFIKTDENLKPGGMDGLQEWLQQIRKILENPARARDYDVSFPKGILLAGLPGSGKSMMAKYVANELGISLLQFNLRAVLSSLVGETEEKMDHVLKLIEACAPCVMWIDEIEKEFSGVGGSGNSDAGVTERCLAKLLHWMQENDRPCFVCATANHIGELPSELLRRGRFERKYYSFLPMHEQCVEILSIHLLKTAKTAPKLFDETVYDPLLSDNFNIKKIGAIGNKVFDAIAKMEERKLFTGADIEGLVQDVKRELFSEDSEIYRLDADSLADRLINVAGRSKPYGETNFQETVEYWCDLQQNPYLNVAVPDNADRNENYKYIPFDFSDILFEGQTWTWRKGLICRSQHSYDKKMFETLREPILEQMNKRVKK